MARVDLPESRLRARKRRRRNAVFVLWAVAILLIAGSVIGLSYLPHWRIVTVEVSGTEGTEAQAVEKEISAQLESRYLFVFPHDNALIYPRSHIKAHLLEEFPTFASVNMKTQGLRTLVVEVTKREPRAVWCGTAKTASEPCKLLDAQGVAYEPAAEFAGPVYTKYYGAVAGSKKPVQYLEPETFRSLEALVLALEEEEKGRVASVEVDGANDVYLRFANGFELRFVLGGGGGDVYERFVLAKGAEPFQSRALSDFEYLDLRFGDRLYYKLKGE